MKLPFTQSQNGEFSYLDMYGFWKLNFVAMLCGVFNYISEAGLYLVIKQSTLTLIPPTSPTNREPHAYVVDVLVILKTTLKTDQ
jgi:hypothetical protein